MDPQDLHNGLNPFLGILRLSESVFPTASRSYHLHSD
ncbi:rCG60371 [Rattus norvegicus]|uniref:RCG60371 n=1 Tax=Rattus norvegicus TaxID=10116 RepID=A6KJF7_RAT|nr:rCG60371 [Rattus norvegicus]